MQGTRWLCIHGPCYPVAKICCYALLLLLADMMRARDSACLAVRFCARGPEGLALIRRPAPNIVVLVRRDTRRTEYRSFLLICAHVPPSDSENSSPPSFDLESTEFGVTEVSEEVSWVDCSVA